MASCGWRLSTRRDLEIDEIKDRQIDARANCCREVADLGEVADEVDGFAGLEEALTIEADDNAQLPTHLEHGVVVELLCDATREVDALVRDELAAARGGDPVR